MNVASSRFAPNEGDPGARIRERKVRQGDHARAWLVRGATTDVPTPPTRSYGRCPRRDIRARIRNGD